MQFRKGGKMLQESGMKLLRKPRSQLLHIRHQRHGEVPAYWRKYLSRTDLPTSILSAEYE